MSRDRIDDALRSLGDAAVTPPPLSEELEAELDGLAPVRPRSPRRGFAVFSLGSLLYGAGLLLALHPRANLADLPRLWLVLYCVAWLAAFVAVGWLAVVPGPGRVMPDWRRAGLGALLASLGFVAAGFLFDQPAAAMGPVALPAAVKRGLGCVMLGLITALVPVVLGALLLRGRVPVGSRWAGAGVGAAGGALGGLFLHLHCPLGDAFHLGLSHGGVVVASAAIGALLIPRAAAP